MEQYIWLVAGWFSYYAIHSLLATDGVKKVFPRKIYRPLYVLVSIAGLLAMLLLNGSIAAINFFKTEGPMRYGSLLLTTFGVMIIHASFRQYSFAGFVGAKVELAVMKTGGILQYMRHPIYAGTILIVMGFFLYIPNLPTLVSCLCTFAYLPIGIYLEEKKLIKQFGDQYVEYRKRVPAVFPKV
jgi:protein-S-isoprenylcysteine O-methyltransferase Ste14